MHRNSDAKASTRPSILSLFALFMALPAMQQAQAHAEARKTRVRARIARIVNACLPGDTAANSAVQGVIEFIVGFVILVICILIAFIIMPLVNSQSAALDADENTSQSQRSVLPLVGLILIVSVIVVCLAFMVHGFRQVLSSIRA